MLIDKSDESCEDTEAVCISEKIRRMLDEKISVSRDNGKTWEMKAAPAGYPPNYGGIPKESPAIVRNPLTREFIRVQPIGGFVFLSKGGAGRQVVCRHE